MTDDRRRPRTLLEQLSHVSSIMDESTDLEIEQIVRHSEDLRRQHDIMSQRYIHDFGNTREVETSSIERQFNQSMSERMRQRRNTGIPEVSTFRMHGHGLTLPICIMHRGGNVIGVQYNEQRCAVKIDHIGGVELIRVECTEFECVISHTRGRDDFDMSDIEHNEPTSLRGQVTQIPEYTGVEAGDGLSIVACNGEDYATTVPLPSEDEIVERVMKEVEKRLSKRKHISLG